MEQVIHSYYWLEQEHSLEDLEQGLVIHRKLEHLEQGLHSYCWLEQVHSWGDLELEEVLHSYH